MDNTNHLFGFLDYYIENACDVFEKARGNLSLNDKETFFNGSAENRHFILDSESIRPFFSKEGDVPFIIMKKKIKESFIKAYVDVYKYGRDETLYNSVEKYKCVYEGLLKEARKLLSVEWENSNIHRMSDSPLEYFVNFLMNRIAHNALEIIMDEVDKNIDIHYDRTDYDAEKPDVIYARLNGVESVIRSTKHFGQLLLVDADEKRYRPEYTILIRIYPAILESLEEWLDICVDCLNGIMVSSQSEIWPQIKCKIDYYISQKEICEEAAKVARKEFESVLNKGEEYWRLKTEKDEAEKKYRRAKIAPNILCRLNDEINAFWYGRKGSSDSLHQKILLDFTMNQKWRFDCPGYVTRDDVKSFTKDDRHIINKGDTVGASRAFSQNVYYARAVDLRDITSIKDGLPSGLFEFSDSNSNQGYQGYGYHFLDEDDVGF